MFAYCGNNPINHSDPLGNAWEHWAIAAGIVAIAAVGVVVASGGIAAAAIAVASVANGVAVSSTAATVAAGVFTGAAYSFVVSAYGAMVESNSAAEFASYGGSALVTTAFGGVFGGAKAYSLAGHACFIEGTVVKTEDGYAAIEDIQPGTLVWAWDEETGDIALKEVIETYARETDELIHVYVNGEKVITTPNHPFYSPILGWTAAIDLQAGDSLVLVDGEYVIVEKVHHEILEVPVKVYNFQVSDYHTYFVSDSGILVHNMCSGGILKGKPYIPKDAERVRHDSRSVTSKTFQDFIRSMGRAFRSSEWKYIMETWVTEFGEEYEVHYWHNHVTGESYYHLRSS